VALTAGGVPTPGDLEDLTTTYVAGQKLRPSDLAEFGVFTDGDKVRMSDFPDFDD
jgi:hypothetical protein